MRYSYALPALAALTSAKTVRIDVGKDGLEFSPSNAKAEMGDMLEFHFYPMQHSVALGMMDKPCEPMDGGFYSGMMPTKDGEAKSVFQVKVESTDAMYYYCSAQQHCQNGMVGAINGDDDMLDKYKSAAADAKENVSPKEVAGGTVMSMDGSGGMMSSTMGSGTMSSTMGGGSGATKTSGSGAMSSPTDNAAAGIKTSVFGVLAAAGGVAALLL